MASVERRWTAEEDGNLRHAVGIHGPTNHWKEVADLVPGRTNKACRKRWLHSLRPQLRKSAWTPAEDTLLVELYTSHGPKWSAIARQIEGRTDDACSKRYREALDPNLKRDEWTLEEDSKLLEVYNRIGGKWGQLGQDLRRSGLACRNRFRLLNRIRPKAKPAAQSADLDEALDAPLGNDCAHFSRAEFDVLYYPPEAYPSAFGNNLPLGESLFREPTPQMPEMFQAPPPSLYSSFSLTAALSDPPRKSLPLPPVPEESYPVDGVWNLSPLQASSSDLFASCSSTVLRPETPLVSGLSDLPSPSSNHSSPWRSPASSFTGLLPPLTESQATSPFGFIPALDPSSSSSSSPSPFVPPASLSPTESPVSCSAVDLPEVQPEVRSPHPFPDSLLLAPLEYYPPLPPKPKRIRPRKPAKPLSEIRLSGDLPVSDDNVRAYACGRPPCWEPGASAGSHCFSTSKELLEHCRTWHAPNDGSVSRQVFVNKNTGLSEAFRCGLAGCNKSWKTLNGLQYHLQVSAAHFRHAVSSHKDAVEGDGQRMHACSEPGCSKAYRQATGLRYHLKHGHKNVPAQLSSVPPTLARELAQPKKTAKNSTNDGSGEPPPP